MKIRKATKEDRRVLVGLFNFLESLELDIFEECGTVKTFEIVRECFLSEEDRFSYNNCFVFEHEEEILGFRFEYHFDDVEKMRDFWFKKIVPSFNLTNKTILFDYDEALAGEYYLDTIYVFDHARSLGVGTELLADFCYKDYPVKSLNVAKDNDNARRLYARFGFYKTCEIKIAGEDYDHLILKN